MARAGGYVLRLSRERHEVFGHAIEIHGVFSEPVSDFSHTRTAPLICFVILDDQNISVVARARRGIVAGTEMRRLNVHEPHQMRTPILIDDVISAADSRFRGRIATTLIKGGYFTPKAFEAAIDAISAVSEEARPLLRRFGRTRRERVESLSPHTRSRLAEQKEAVLLALAIGDMNRRHLHEWEPPAEGQPSSFLDGLPSAVMREDAMIVHDLTNVPGFDLVRTLPYTAAVFQGDGKRLTVVLANRLPLEQLTGTDLIYYNETHASFVMVQYKAMDDEAGTATFRLPDEGLDKEVARMRSIEAQLRGVAVHPSKENYRLCCGPFYVKLCARTQFNPDDIKLFPGMYFPLEHWSRVASDPTLLGKRGGQMVTYSNVGRHIDNDLFIRLVAGAWVGSYMEQSAVLRAAIEGTLQAGRGVALAVETASEDDSESQDLLSYEE